MEGEQHPPASLARAVSYRANVSAMPPMMASTSVAVGWMVAPAGGQQSVSPDLHEARLSQGQGSQQPRGVACDVCGEGT